MVFSKNEILKSLLILLLFTVPAISLADTTTYVENTDIAMEILKALFAGSVNFGSGEDGFQGIVLVINFFAITLSCIYVTITIISQLLKGATTGQILHGETKVSIPLRFFFAILMPAPILNGYAIIQVILLYIIAGIFDLNSITWTLFTDKTNFIRTLATSPVQPESKRLARNILMMSMCMRAYEFQAKRGGRSLNMGWSVGFGESKKTWYGANTGATLAPTSAGARVVDGENSLVELIRSEKTKTVQLMAGDPSNSGEVKHNSCGYVNVKSFYDAKTNTWEEIGKTAVDAGTGIYLAKKVSDSDLGVTASWGAWTAAAVNSFDAIIKGVYNVSERKQWAEQAAYGHAKALEDLMLEADQISYAIYSKVENEEARYNQKIASQSGIAPEQYGMNTQLMPETMGKEQIIAAIDGLASRYQNTLRTQAGMAKNGGEQYEKLVQDAQKYGWLTAGMIFTQAASVSDSINEMAMTMPETEVVLTAQETMLNKDFNSRYLSKINEYFQNSNVYKDDNYVVAITDKDIKDSKEGEDKQNRSGGLFGGLGDYLVNLSLDFFIEPNSHPVAQMRRWGQTLIIGSGALTVQNGLNLSQQNSGDVSYTIVYRTVLWATAGAMMVIGIIMAYLIPMLPTFYWIGIIIGIFSNIIQMILMSSLFASFHALPYQGGDFAGNQRMGWQMLFVGCIRSFFSLCGFIGAFILMAVLGVVLNMIFMFIYKASTLDGSGLILSIVNVFIMPIIYFIMTVLLLKNSIALIPAITDGMGNFIGGAFQIGGNAEQFGGGFSSALNNLANKSATPISSIRNDLAEIERLKNNNKDDSTPIITPPMNGDAGEGSADTPDGDIPPTVPSGGGSSIAQLPTTLTTVAGEMASGANSSIQSQSSIATPPMGGSWEAVNNYSGIATDYAGVDLASSESVMQPNNFSDEQREQAAQKVAAWAKAQNIPATQDGRASVEAMYNAVATEMQTGSKEYGDTAHDLTMDMHRHYSGRPGVYEARMKQLNQRLNPDPSNKYASYYGTENMLSGTSQYIQQGKNPREAWNLASEDIAQRIEDNS